jgi:proline dehydrogenase
MNPINAIIVKSVQVLPRSVIRRFANRYIAGDSLKDAVETTKNLNDKGIMGTLDVLGEDVFNKEDALRARDECLEVLAAIDKHKLDSNHSLKLTQLGLKTDIDFCLNNLKEILSAASSLNIFVRIDMEDHTCTDDTLNIYKEAVKSFPECGVAVQAYLKRTFNDVSELVKSGTNFRLCKGIYVEPEEIAYKDKEEIRNNFQKVLKLMLENNCYTGIATHDEVLVEKAYRAISEAGRNKTQYEFQMLLGVREWLRDKILKDGHRIRIYIPFGTHWYQYSVRRFKENPQMAGYVLKNILGKK